MISLHKCTMQLARPYPVAVYDDIMSEADFEALVSTFPQALSGERRRAAGEGRYNKDFLADRHHSSKFLEVIDALPLWRKFYDEVKETFPEQCQKALGPVGFDRSKYSKVSVAIEFSSLPGEGGGLQPHPDSAKKVATAVYYMEPDWQDEWGGHFEVLRDLQEREEESLIPWNEVATVETAHMRPRRVVFMQRTPISYHGVRPLKAPRPRRSITVNLIAR